MERLLFGTAGTPTSSKRKSSISGIKQTHELGLGCMELQFLHDVRMGEKTARTVGEVAKELDIKLSAHAPYYTNLNTYGAKFFVNKGRILQSAKIASICGARSVVIHAASYQRDIPQAVYERVKNTLGSIQKQLRDEGMDITLRVETTGRRSQFGNLDEVLALTEVEGVLPCIDFPHLHARTGRYDSGEEFALVLAQVEYTLGHEGLNDMYIHATGVEAWEKERRMHFALEEPDSKYKELAQVFSDFDVRGMVICGYPNLEKDALELKREYE
ncbi:endonuclease IV [Candidatus Methanoperedens nitroreducens]|uniref:Endonuclease IV n=1 Tax=Candidatus Methanoperedens nitratireducens TaxID=1392998 RepID=A0A062VB25_9EURY|nr:TIM barrel protein [Candidatus Methanoperedens nitroreducens]KCZ72510.1 endonuclease IV [Candidatus Methanoperedens nitroreducens]MDJ1423556.1 TIM barrel protein [Candidatus Methanoperedens sp.]